jgi:hypothetical protein
VTVRPKLKEERAAYTPEEVRKRVGGSESKPEAAASPAGTGPGAFPGMVPQPPPPKQENTSPVDAWGSMAMLAAALGGAKSRFHATTALNAAAGVLQGIHKRDQEDFKSKFDTWKIAAENANRIQSYEIEAYRAAMQRTNMDFNNFMKMNASQQRDVAAELRAQALSMQNDRLRDQVDHWKWDEIFHEQQAREKANEQSQKEYDKMNDTGRTIQEYNNTFYIGGAPKDPSTPPPPYQQWLQQTHPEVAKKLGYKPPEPAATPTQEGGGLWSRLFGGGSPAAATPPVASPGVAGGGSVGQTKGMVAPGNIDLTKRPVVHNSDGTISTVRSISIEDDGKTILIPTVVGDKVVSNKEAIEHYRKTGERLGVFDNEQNADAYAESLHEGQASYYKGGVNNAPAAHERVFEDPTRGKIRYKGTGDYDDPKNWEPVTSSSSGRVTVD